MTSSSKICSVNISVEPPETLPFPRDEITVLPLPESTAYYLKNLGLTLKRPVFARETQISALLTLIFTSVLGLLLPDSKETPRSFDYSYVDTLESLVNGYYNKEGITLDFFARNLHLSPRQTSRIFKKIYNKSFPAVINEKKLSVACMLLANTDMRINAVIRHVNFSTENYFFLLFKQKYGMTPSRYRKKYKTH